MKKIVGIIIVVAFVSSMAFAENLILHGIQVSDENMNEMQRMTEKEKDYLINYLEKVKKGMARDEVFFILGTPSRDLPQKVNWWVQPDSKKIRAGVSFWNNKATEAVLDGGWGSFYYRQKL